VFVCGVEDVVWLVGYFVVFCNMDEDVECEVEYFWLVEV